MTDIELQLIASSVRGFVDEKIASATAPLLSEIKSLRDQLGALPPPRDGKDIDPEIVKLAIAGEVTRQIAEIPKPKDGVSPAPVDMVQVKSLVDDAVILAVEALPKPKDGVDGKDLAPMPEVEFYEKVYGCIMNHLENPGSLMTKAVNNRIRMELREFPLPKDGKDAEPVDTEKVIAEVLAQIPAPINGKDGSNGKDGASVEPDMIRSMVIAEVAAIPRPKDGKDAEPIHPDTIRMMVTEEARKAVAELPKVKDGERGEPGRDAFELDILPSLDRTRSVPRGTVARHSGGLMRAFRDTESSKDGDGPLEKFGWECIFDGIAEVPTLMQGEDLRTFTLQFALTSGKAVASQFRLPVLLDRGVFKDGSEYVRGDGVTYDGSFWICQVDATKARPGTSADFRLAVKRGGEGKPGKSAIEPPKPGPVRLS